MDASFERGSADSSRRLVGYLDSDLLVDFFLDRGLTLGHRSEMLMCVSPHRILRIHVLFPVSSVTNCSCLSFSYAGLR